VRASVRSAVQAQSNHVKVFIYVSLVSRVYIFLPQVVGSGSSQCIVITPRHPACESIIAKTRLPGTPPHPAGLQSKYPTHLPLHTSPFTRHTSCVTLYRQNLVSYGNRFILDCSKVQYIRASYSVSFPESPFLTFASCPFAALPSCNQSCPWLRNCRTPPVPLLSHFLLVFLLLPLFAVAHFCAGGGERGQLLQPQDDPPPFIDTGSSLVNLAASVYQPVAAAWSFKSSGIAHALARASSATNEHASKHEDGAASGVRMLPPGQSKSFAWAAVQGKGRAVRLADGQPVSSRSNENMVVISIAVPVLCVLCNRHQLHFSRLSCD
jgi:hypothetical protein